MDAVPVRPEDEILREVEREIAAAPLTTLQPTKTKQKQRGGRRKTRRRRRRRRKQRAGWICPCGKGHAPGTSCTICGNWGPTALETHQAGVAIQRAWRAKRSRRDGKDEHGQGRKKQRGGFDPIPKFRYKPKVFLNASAPKEAPIPPKPWW